MNEKLKMLAWSNDNKLINISEKISDMLVNCNDVLRYTEMKDKYNNEIYENFILCFVFGTGKVNYTIPYLVQMKNGKWILYHQGLFEIPLSDACKKYKVVGNKYDNPGMYRDIIEGKKYK